MNFLNQSYLARYGRLAFWTTPCCKDIKSTNLKNSKENGLQLCKCNTLGKVHTKLCTGNLCLMSGLTLWMQVRTWVQYQKDCPRLHRDVEFPNFDAYRKDDYIDARKTGWGSGDSKPGFTYVVGFFGFLCGTYAVKSEVFHFVSYMAAAADVLASASIEVDISKVAPGACVSYKWRGKPLFIKHRTQADIDFEANTPLSSLRDPETPEQRTVNPEWLVVIGICTHLGCVPIPNSGDWAGGFYCPCHGSHYDNVGRARKGPAPLNLEVPPYKFMSNTLIMVG
ncbi:ubiquinol-cytochrome c reductase iron-sulfur subunit-like [Galleria mellonella]|uniref:Cytochrome b-c1 complex subunit Rieske, mitochondrial n=1 Tax=Galleria mellonella TaxID=7137 RepID=A0A6J1X789_GALME|nr:ubiquinol-cytochrome c reductase iron-sulfur subunit-like [Galleria mellonella]